MAKITVTVLPELYPVSGNLFQKAILKLVPSPSWIGPLVLGFDKNFFPIRVGKNPPLVTYDPWILISEDLQDLFISEGSFYADSLQVSCFIKADNSGQIFPINQNNNPIITDIPNPNNFPLELSTSNSVVNVSKLSQVALFKINVPRGAILSYTLTDITTKNINFYSSYYSVNYGSTWTINTIAPITIPASSNGVIFIYIQITNEVNNIGNENLSFLLNLSIVDSIEYITAEYGDNPNPSKKGQIIGNYLINQKQLPNKVLGPQKSPVPYGTFNRCLNDRGLAEFYGDSTISINGGQISYTYSYYQGIYPRCIK